MMVHSELTTTTTFQNKPISGSGNDDEHEDGHVGPGDHGLETTDATTPGLCTEDLDGVCKSERYQTPGDPAGDSRKAFSQVKKVMSASGTGSAPTLTVKKVLNSGTFGAGSVKPIGAKAPVSATVSKPSAPALKKSTTSPPSAKAAASSPASPKPTAIATRRASVVPAKANSPALSKQSLSASATAKPLAADAILRASPTGPMSSAKSPAPTPVPTKPRASVSAEAAKKSPLTARPSVTSFAKPAGPSKLTIVSRSSDAPPLKASRPMASISSIKETKEVSSKERKDDVNAINEVRGQLDEVNKLLESKMVVVAALEAKIVRLEELLASANVDIDAKTNSATETHNALLRAEATFAETSHSLNALQQELAAVKFSRESLEKELETTKSTVLVKEEVEQSLNSQLGNLNATVVTYREQIRELEKHHSAALAKVEDAAAVEREVLSKAQADYVAISEEMEALRVSHAQVVETQNFQRLATEETLKTQLSTLKAEKDETASKISELEVEILELKEVQEKLEDVQSSLQQQVKELKQELVAVNAALTLSDDNAKRKEVEFIEKLNKMSSTHEEALEAQAAQVVLATTALEKLQAEHAEELAGHEQTKRNLVDQEVKHLGEQKHLEKVHTGALASLSSQLEEVSRNLSEQEAIYNTKVEEVKIDHTKLLGEAFERAKNEAAHAHTQELQALRSESEQGIKQLQEANRVSLEELKAEHSSELELEVNGLNKQINTLNVQLKATQEDLAKAKTSLEIVRGETESLTRQRDEAHARAEAVPSINPEQAEEIAHLTKELSRTKDDLEVTTDMLNLTKSSLSELSDKQAKELEAAAKGRADEVLRLRAVHDEAVSQLATQTSELQVRISDLEGELATAKTILAAKEAASPKANGIEVSHPPGVTKDELQQLYEAHNLKLHDTQAEHDKEISLARTELETALRQIAELHEDISRKAMEIQLHEQEEEEQQEQITRLKEDLESLSEKIAQQ